MKVGILADDLTSATDGAAPFVSRGHRCVVFTDHRQSPPDDVAIISVNKASRTAPVAEASERAAVAAKHLSSAGILYNTVDSTIRGHLEAEITAALGASGRSLAVLSPAFPDGGRTTEGGRQLLNGVPLEHTAFGRDPLHPIRDSHLRALFPGIPESDIRILGLPAVRALKPGDLVADGRKLLIADATRQEDLALLVRAAADPGTILWCGSPGLANALADFVGVADDAGSAAAPASLTLFVIGSVNPLSREQCARLMGSGNVQQLTISAAATSRSPALAAQEAVAQYTPGSSTNVILTTSDSGPSANPRAVAIALGQAAHELMQRHAVTGLFLTGGDTAEAVLGELDISSLELLGEIEPGIPIGRMTGSHPVHIINTAGGFGSPDVLLTSAELLRGLWLGDKT